MFNTLIQLLAILSVTAAEPIKVAVIDTGVDLKDYRFNGFLCKDGHKDFTDEGIKDEDGHGTHIAGIIVNVANVDGYCLVIIKAYSDKKTGEQQRTAETKAIEYAVKIGVKIVNISGGGQGYDKREYEVIKAAKHITFVVAAGNDSKRSISGSYSFYPAYYRLKHGLMNVTAVGSLNDNGSISSFSNYGDSWEYGVKVLSYYKDGKYAIMSGTSQATAKKTGQVLKTMLGYK